MRYRVLGRDAANNNAVEMTIDADSAGGAEQYAVARGILVDSVSRIDQPAARAPVPDTTLVSETVPAASTDLPRRLAPDFASNASEAAPPQALPQKPLGARSVGQVWWTLLCVGVALQLLGQVIAIGFPTSASRPPIVMLAWGVIGGCAVLLGGRARRTIVMVIATVTITDGVFLMLMNLNTCGLLP